jgi:hypothetical protein
MRYRSLLNRQVIVVAEGILKLGGQGGNRTHLNLVKSQVHSAGLSPTQFGTRGGSRTHIFIQLPYSAFVAPAVTRAENFIQLSY